MNERMNKGINDWINNDWCYRINVKISLMSVQVDEKSDMTLHKMHDKSFQTVNNQDYFWFCGCNNRYKTFQEKNQNDTLFSNDFLVLSYEDFNSINSFDLISNSSFNSFKLWISCLATSRLQASSRSS